MIKNRALLIFAILILNACSKAENNNSRFILSQNTNQEWLVPFTEIVDSGGGKEAIRSINNPTFFGNI